MENKKIKIIENKLLYCPECEKEHEVKLIKRNNKCIIKGEVVTYEEEVYFCEINEEIFETAEMTNKNLLSARNAYRKQKNLLTSFEIKKIREKYDITQEELASLLNLGEKTIARYETKAIQEEPYNTLLVMFNNNYNFALECLYKNKDNFSKKRYFEIFNKISYFIETLSSEQLLEQSLENDYLILNSNNNANGNQKLNINKIKNMMIYFVKNTRNVFKVKLIKLFWYADSIAFLKNRKSMSGLVYQHKPYGALPIGWEKIISLDVVNKEYVDFVDFTSTQLIPGDAKFDKTIFDESELLILDKICTKFKDIKASEISKIMHDEDIYKNTKDGDILNYSLIKKLKIKL